MSRKNVNKVYIDCSLTAELAVLLFNDGEIFDEDKHSVMEWFRQYQYCTRTLKTTIGVLL